MNNVVIHKLYTLLNATMINVVSICQYTIISQYCEQYFLCYTSILKYKYPKIVSFSSLIIAALKP